ncbi:hypothetical protein BC792_103126 [Sphingobacterium allocomposti]|jgi:hypothetical protein|uniref:Uncharacterized protein n=1 Tax=Sphingobacterium allocomposti TaxID=415956 RepID=A0A5S5DMN4_9SPHI|nr:hypothetical protein [Sphingobacterium composti Yoo et al. 2007 non Ten et al. 2007]TYP97200.1 hypothetical protein BC792_103126 [Sphingobacterium composti Yoo et al. 2007 non Ten et al. 2007]HLS94604.1 hypothetical protein [Sphingobacterium sp.]
MSIRENRPNGQDSLLGDLEKTIIVNQLMEVPFAERNEAWRDRFLGNIAGANLKLGDPEVILSNDGFPYVQLQTVKNDESFQAYVIEHQLEVLLEQGFGVVVNAHLEQPDWVFSYGDLVNLKQCGSFYTDKSFFSNPKEYNSIGQDEDILVGQPSEDIFPSYLRKHVRDFLQYAGVKHPKVMLIARNYTDEERASQDIVFNVMPKQFASEKDFTNLMNTLQWFLPKHYSFFGVDEMAIENGFEPL